VSTVSTLPSHVQLMLMATRRQLSVGDVDGIERLTTITTDWEAFLGVTTHQRIAPLVFENLDQIKPKGMPDFVLDRLRIEATMNAFAALTAMREIDRIGQMFTSAGFEMSVLKGVPLSQTLFGKPNTRHVGDIDLLTSPGNLPEKLELLAGAGYERINPRVRLTPQRLASYTTFRKDFTCRNRDTGRDLDLHWRLFDNRQHAGNQILTQANYRTVDVYGMSTRTFSLQDQFLYIAAHGVSDAWMYLKSLTDVAAFLHLLTAEELDEALLRAQELGVLTQVSAAIHFANEWLGAGIASGRLLSADDSLVRYIRKRSLTLMLRHDFHPNRTHLSTLDWLQLEMKLVPGPRSFAEIVGHVLWRPRAWSAVDLPDHLFWMYPLIGLVLPPRRHSLDY
jgi:hypothetical protein